MDQANGYFATPGAMVFVAFCALFVGAPVVLYRVAARRNRSSWDARVTVRAAGAYRAAPLEVLRPGQIPSIVSVASILSLLAASAGLVVLMLTWHGAEVLAIVLAATVVGCVLTRRSYASGCAAVALGAVELFFAAAFAPSDAIAVLVPLAALHAALLGAAAVVHVRATLRACA